jgi:hypothetical protein
VNLKKIYISFLTIFISFGFITVLSSNEPKTFNIDAVSNSGQIRIGVVRPTWWKSSSANQYLRISDSATNLNTSSPDSSQRSNITLVSTSGYADDEYYRETSRAVPEAPRFTEYDTDGIIFYDVDISSIVGKYWDLVRYSSNDSLTASVWNRVAVNYTSTFASGDNHKIYRIFGDGSGVFSPNSTETSNISGLGIAGIMYGYLTCSASTNNGYGAFGTIDTQYNLSRTFSSGIIVTDYAYGSDYSSSRDTGISVPLNDKISAMRTSYNSLN